MSNFHINDNVIVSHAVTGHEFTATVEHIYSEDSPKFGLIRVVDQDGDAWDVEEVEIWLADTDDEHGNCDDD